MLVNEAPKLPLLKQDMGAAWPTFQLDTSTRGAISGGRMPRTRFAVSAPKRSPAAPVVSTPGMTPPPPPERFEVPVPPTVPLTYGPEGSTSGGAGTPPPSPGTGQRVPVPVVAGGKQVYGAEGASGSVATFAQHAPSVQPRGPTMYEPEGSKGLPAMPSSPPVPTRGGLGGWLDARPARDLAKWAVVFGMLTVVLSLVAGVPALVCGISLLRRRNVDASARAWATTGIVTAIVAIGVQLVFLISRL